MTLEPTNKVSSEAPTNEQPAPEPSGQQSLFDKNAHRRNLQAAQGALLQEFQTLIGDTERLLKYTQDTAGTQAQELRSRLSANISRAQSMLKERQGTLNSQGQAAIQCTEEYVHTHPWQSIGIAAGVGFLLGLIARR
ncbi:DUF883 family protein [Stutzerimonas azotifigens]|uniref:DUF883 family protein n=1 Tax=Stutzerimonas azotifigens TaxID=291995 RepID=UPI000424B66B|nr:DUF883 family protein [Stutzerimonas azotifigens]